MSKSPKVLSEEKPHLLIVEDDKGLQKQLKWSFSDYNVLTADDRESGLKLLKEFRPPVVILDLGLPPDPANATEGLAALQDILSLEPHTKIIVVTGNDEKENALKAVDMGAYDFYQKPVDQDILGHIVDRAYRFHSLEQENRDLSRTSGKTSLQGIIAISESMRDVCKTIEKIAPTDLTVLLLGESGTGKELLAHALHDCGLRKDNAFIAINCAAIPETLLESELFGYEKGAYTGAAKTTRGKIEYASRGTLFLDEVGDLPLALQAKLLRFLQERVIERVGGREEIPVDVRVVCATHQNLEEKLKLGEFREDLYYRICEMTISIPPLRERPDDAVVLAQHFLNINKTTSTKAKRFSKGAIEAMEHYEWQGNARELENKVKRALIFTESDTVTEVDMGLKPAPNPVDEPELVELKMVREIAERHAIERVLRHCDGKISKAARILGVSRPTLYDLIEKYGLNS
ncbi:MAG: PEP-CTERM-box response regulator transcription factor [Gammaproteobacteria bacterium RIFCSPLOWO2_02_FULL_56_15]|nr:MAG: PEP-CTERM-box response regulator transcription factor [Gammaproteobacteria bacterium RIFCSPLOWO2_02_FULL_56_15]